MSKHDLTPLYLEEDEWHELEFHTLCTFFPEMEEADYDSLKSSMEANGFLKSDPIVVLDINDDAPVGTPPCYQVLDGRNRFLAACDTATKPEFLQYVGDDPAGFVMSRNLGRRHLKTGQKAAIAAKLANLEFGANQFREGGMTQSQAAALVGVGEATIRRFKFVERHAPEVADQVASGELPLEKARAKAQAAQAAKAEQEKGGTNLASSPESQQGRSAERPSEPSTDPASPEAAPPSDPPTSGTRTDPPARGDERPHGSDDAAMSDIDPTTDGEALINPIHELINRARQQGWDTLADAAEGEYFAMMKEMNYHD